MLHERDHTVDVITRHNEIAVASCTRASDTKRQSLGSFGCYAPVLLSNLDHFKPPAYIHYLKLGTIAVPCAWATTRPDNRTVL
jgi:hypothetical protein